MLRVWRAYRAEVDPTRINHRAGLFGTPYRCCPVSYSRQRPSVGRHHREVTSHVFLGDPPHIAGGARLRVLKVMTLVPVGFDAMDGLRRSSALPWRQRYVAGRLLHWGGVLYKLGGIPLTSSELGGSSLSRRVAATILASPSHGSNERGSVPHVVKPPRR